MRRDVATSILLLAALFAGTSHAQATGAWTVESEFDLFSYLGLGSIWVPAYQHPEDLSANDAVLVVGCDDQSPNGYEVSAWVAATPFPVDRERRWRRVRARPLRPRTGRHPERGS